MNIPDGVIVLGFEEIRDFRVRKCVFSRRVPCFGKDLCLEVFHPTTRSSLRICALTMLDLKYLSNPEIPPVAVNTWDKRSRKPTNWNQDPIEYEFSQIGINEDGIWVDESGRALTPSDLGSLVWSAVCKVSRFSVSAPSIDILRDSFWSTFMEDSVNCAIVCRIHDG